MPGPGTRAGGTTGYALSAQQQRLAQTGGHRARCMLVAELDGPPPDGLEAWLAGVQGRHEVLRSAFPRVPGRRVGVQVPLENPPAPAVVRRDATGGEVVRAAREEARRLDLRPEDGRTLGATVVEGGGRAALALVASPLAADAASLAVLAGALLGGAAPADVRYAGYASWQRREQHGERSRAWREQVAEGPLDDLLQARLPAMHPQATGDAGRSVRVPGVPAGLPPGAIMTAVAVLLARVTGVDRAALTVTDGGRRLEGLPLAVGPYESAFPLVLALDERLPLPALVEAVNAAAEAEASRAHLFDWDWVGAARQQPVPVAFVHRHAPPVLPGTRTVELSAPPPAALLTAVLTDGARQRVDLGYGEAVGDRYARILAGQLASLLRALEAAGWAAVREVTIPGDSIARGRRTGGEAPVLAHRRIWRRAAEEPDRPAITDRSGTTTFAALTRQAEALAARLVAAGAGSGTHVAALVSRSRHYAVAALAAARTGGTFVPFDPAHSLARLRQARADGLADLCVAETATAGSVVAGLPTLLIDGAPAAGGVLPWPADRDEAAEDLPCYVMYTSGSTGRPKPVALTHRNLAHYAEALPEAVGLDPEDRVLHTAALGFSSSIRQTLVVLAHGGHVVVPGDEELRDPVRLLERAVEHGVTVLDLIPSLWRRVLAAVKQDTRLRAATGKRLRLLLSASEPLTADVAGGLLGFAPGARVVNMYGQTETTGIVAATPLGADDLHADVQPLGRPLPGLDILVLDDAGRLVPAGFTGTIHVHGPTVGTGDPTRPGAGDLVDHTAGGTARRLYDTGDTGFIDADGVLRARGRADDQVKVRGFRVELGEVMAGLARHPAVRDVAVVAAPGPGGDTVLTAYVVPELDQRPTYIDLTSFLAQRVPSYMIPATLQLLAELPRNASGKVDREAVRTAPAGKRQAAGRVAPRTLVEQQLATIVGDVLEVEQVGVTDNIFDLGTTSLLGIDMMARVREQLGVSVPWTTIFANPTVERLAAKLDSEASGSSREGWIEAPL